MTFIQAVELMKQGKKLTHRYFSDNEWVTMQGNLTMIFEDGVKCIADAINEKLTKV